MRRKHSEVTDPAKIAEILSSTAIGRLGTVGLHENRRDFEKVHD